MQPSSIIPEPAIGQHQQPEKTSQTVFSGDVQPVRAQPVGQTNDPIPVVKMLSTRGVEYGMMTMVLWLVATSLAWIGLNYIHGGKGFDSVVVPVSVLIVSVPFFGFLFLRLKKAELSNPALKHEPSKRRWSQMTQFLAFFACLVNLIFFVYTIMQHFGSSKSESIGKAVLDLAVILIIAGGILAYYWADEHRLGK